MLVKVLFLDLMMVVKGDISACPTNFKPVSPHNLMRQFLKSLILCMHVLVCVCMRVYIHTHIYLFCFSEEPSLTDTNLGSKSSSTEKES